MLGLLLGFFWTSFGEGDTLLQMSEPFLVDTTRTIVSVGGDCPALAYGDSVYLAVYAEWRGDVNGIYAMRIDNQGRLLDSINLQVSLGGYYPDVAYAKQSGIFLVVWHEAGSIRGKRISSSGQILDNDDIIISGSSPQASYPSVSSNGKDFFVVWKDGRNGTNDIYGARVSSTGQVLDEEGIRIEESAGSRKISYGAGYYFVVYYNNDGLYGKRITPEGEIRDQTPKKIADSLGSPSVAFDGRKFLVVASSGGIYGIRVDTNGVVIDSVPKRLNSDTLTGRRGRIAISGDKCMIVYEHKVSVWDEDVYGVFTDTAFNVIDSSMVVLDDDTYQEDPVVAGSDSNFLAMMQNLDGVRISKSGQVLDATPIHYSYAGNEQESPAVAFNGWEYLIAYATDKGEGTGKDIYAVRISQYGERIGEPIPVCTDSGNQADLRLRVSSAEKNFLVVWDDDGNIFGRIIEEDGTESSSVFMINSPEYTDNNQPAIASDGKRYLVIWYSGGYLVGRFIGSDGRLGNTIDLAKAGWDGHCDIIYDGEAYFIVYDTYDYPDSDVRGIRLSREGGGLSSGWIASNDNYQESYPVVVYNGKEYFVIWADYRNWDTTGTDIYGVWLDKDCRVLSSDVKISDDVSLEYPKAGVRVGDNILISWSRDNSLYSAIIKRDNIGSPFQLDTLGGCGEVLFCEGNENTAYMVYSAFAGNPYCNRRVWGKFVRYKEENKLPITQLIIYPIVNNGRFTLKFTGWESGNIDLCLYDIVGREIRGLGNKDIYEGMNEISMNIGNLPSGKYFLMMKDERGQMVKPFIILK